MLGSMVLGRVLVIRFAMISACGPAQTYNAKFGFEVRALFGYCILKDATHTIRTGARRPKLPHECAEGS